LRATPLSLILTSTSGQLFTVIGITSITPPTKLLQIATNAALLLPACRAKDVALICIDLDQFIGLGSALITLTFKGVKMQKNNLN